MSEKVDGIMATMDILEDLLILDGVTGADLMGTSLAGCGADDLGRTAAAALLAQTGLDPAQIDSPDWTRLEDLSPGCRVYGVRRRTLARQRVTGVLASLSLRKLAPAPVDPSNAVEQKAPAIALGKRLFADTRFSSNGAVSCASCVSLSSPNRSARY